jgi:hypothetical protein
MTTGLLGGLNGGEENKAEVDPPLTLASAEARETKDALAKYDEALKNAPHWTQLKKARDLIGKFSISMIPAVSGVDSVSPIAG